MDLQQLLKSFIVTDLAFSTTFCVGALLEHRNNAFMLIFVFLIAATYYPLFQYVRDAISSNVIQDRIWHFRYSTSCVYYCGSRILLFVIFVMVAITDMNAMDVFYAFVHFPVVITVLTCILLVSLLFLIALTLKINPIHATFIDSVVNSMQINATIRHLSEDVAAQRVQFSGFRHLNTKCAHMVVLVPNAHADSNARLYTEFVKREDDTAFFDGR